MKNRLLYCWLLLALAALCYPACSLYAQLNAELLHQLVEHSKDEHTRQVTARNKQAVTSAQEEVNSHKTADLKAGYTLLESRFKTLQQALQVLSLGLESAPIARDIARQQQRVIDLAAAHPELLIIALTAQKEIGVQASLLTRFLLGLFISAGDLNQMKDSDRRILYSYAVNELRALAASIRTLAKTMEASVYKKDQNSSSFGEFINIDIPIADQVLQREKE
ncbi:hypothetical protein HP439_04620 [Sphingobacterium shayense]|uniref:hypothetical protein n=1 Tax=Sphingobacterium shayense TaxID=626343 RepID=UPI001557F17A|nr:hypothetical protein [Sphingobacterium shayense]NQD70005.1 hypothetical protein [Sphingobacterium shayense]